MPYTIISFTGDFPVEKQPYWYHEYENKESAINHAVIQHFLLLKEHSELYTVVVDDPDGDNVLWIMYKDNEINDVVEATKLADSLRGE